MICRQSRMGPKPSRTRSVARALTLAVVTLLAGLQTATAHPHVFIDADAALVFNKTGQWAAIRVTWTYDEFYSLMMIEDAQLDANGDGIPEPERLNAFAGKDVDWAAGFPGHILVEHKGAPVVLGPPLEHRAAYENDRIKTSHLRPLEYPVKVTAADPLFLRLYDPEYFVAYDTPRKPTIQGDAECKVARRPPDTSGQQDLLAQLQQLDMETSSIAFMHMPDVGITFADGFLVTCGGR
ncbi:ABC-type uncharacterized transport system, substrate-binding protein [Paracoccus laeviglucosivorans]|uniref:ABC-type uncharacterized transport system, substrate-binding protein n=2 Tax=Paracoccus laeviglucosivorans TaxID=1197861 RepID=A0A521FRU2_9RHOB|nr:ABC-type uncharacterized transport system, substrate-binding protein [Paracoccus laeviglucosivorans]